MRVQKKSSSLIGIVAGFALSGCASGVYQDARGPIVVNDDAWQEGGGQIVVQRYSGLSTHDVESRLVELARTARKEDAWLYRPKARELIDNGYNGRPSETKFICAKEFVEGESELIFYHIHPCLCTRDSIHRGCVAREPVLNSGDVEVLSCLSAKYSDFKVEARIVNQFGVLRMRIEDARFLSVPAVKEYGLRRLRGDIDFNEYQRRCATHGLSVAFDERAPFISPLSTE